MDDLISKQSVLDIADDLRDRMTVVGYWSAIERVKALPSAQTERTDCTECNEYDNEEKTCPHYCEVMRSTADGLQVEAYCKKRKLPDVPDINVGNCPYCHEDSDGFVFPIEKNGHACVWHDVDGWVISLKAKGWRGSCHIKFCPMCGRRLKHG